MAGIYLVRHGQASFGSADYDQLSPLGVEQSGILGAELRERLANPVSWSGTLRRHQQTAEACLQAANWPAECVEDAGLNEFDHLNVIQVMRPEWQDRQVMVTDLSKAPVPRKAFQDAFETAVKRWISGRFDDEYNESWPAFKTRVLDAFQRVQNALGKGQDALVFTSGGPIAVICGELLGLDVRHSFRLNEVLVNTGVTHLLSSSQRVSLSYFNNFSHLETRGKRLVTYR